MSLVPGHAADVDVASPFITDQGRPRLDITRIYSRRRQLYAILSFFRMFSVFSVRWSTNLTYLEDASEEQLQMLQHGQLQSCPRLSKQIGLFIASSSSTLYIDMEDDGGKQMGHVVLVCSKREGKRSVALLRFQQLPRFSPVGLIFSFVFAGMAAAAAPSMSPSYPTGAAAFVAKLWFDYVLSKMDVSAIAAIDELQRQGLLEVSPEGQLDFVQRRDA